MRLFLTYLLLVFTLSVSAQKIRFTDHSNKWITWWNDAECGYVARYYYGSDTIHYGVHYKKLISFSTMRWTATPGGCSPYVLDSSWFIREDTLTNKVYYKQMQSSDTNEYILYDYNLLAGDTILYGSIYGLGYKDSVYRIDSVSINGAYHKVMHFNMGDMAYAREYTVVEGVGSLSGPLYTPHGHCFEFDEQVMCFSNKGVSPDFLVDNNACYVHDTFKNSWSCLKLSTGSVVQSKQLQVYPNPANETLNVSIDGYTDFPFALVVSDLLGHIVLQSSVENNGKIAVPVADLPQGTYILSFGNCLYSERKVITVVH